MGFYIVVLCLFFTTMGLMYGEAKYIKGRTDVVEELIEKYAKEKHGE